MAVGGAPLPPSEVRDARGARQVAILLMLSRATAVARSCMLRFATLPFLAKQKCFAKYFSISRWCTGTCGYHVIYGSSDPIGSSYYSARCIKSLATSLSSQTRLIQVVHVRTSKRVDEPC